MFRTYKRSGSFHTLMEIFKALRIFRTDTHQAFYRRRIRHGRQNMFCDDRFTGSHNHLDTGSLTTIHNIFLCQQVCSRDDHCSQLVQSNDRKPEFIPAFQNQHDLISMTDSQTLEIGGGHVSIFLQVRIRKLYMCSFVVCPQQRIFIGLFSRPGIYHIITEIKIFRHLHFKIRNEILL